MFPRGLPTLLGAASLDDLDDVLDQFNPSTTHEPSPPVAAPTSADSKTTTRNPPPRPPPPASFPDPDDDDLPLEDGIAEDDLDLSGLDPAIAKDLEQGMKALFDAFGAGAGTGANPGSGIPGLDGIGDDGEFDDEEFKRAMQDILKNGAGAGEGTGSAEDTRELQNLMAALGMGAGTAEAPSASPPTTKATPPTTAKGKDKDASAASSTPPPANFQDAIAASLSKMQSSSTNAAQAAQQSQSQAENANLASMLAGLSGMPDLSQLGDLGGEEGLQGMLDEMMKQLMSREMLYEPLKELSEKVCRIRSLCPSRSHSLTPTHARFDDGSTRLTLLPLDQPSRRRTSSDTRSNTRSSFRSCPSSRNPAPTNPSRSNPSRRRSGRRNGLKRWSNSSQR